MAGKWVRYLTTGEPEESAFVDDSFNAFSSEVSKATEHWVFVPEGMDPSEAIYKDMIGTLKSVSITDGMVSVDSAAMDFSLPDAEEIQLMINNWPPPPQTITIELSTKDAIPLLKQMVSGYAADTYSTTTAVFEGFSAAVQSTNASMSELIAFPGMPSNEYSILARKMAAKIPDMQRIEACPGPTLDGWPCSARPVFEMVVHLNDHHRWSRERIAEWMDQLVVTKKYNFTFPNPEEGENHGNGDGYVGYDIGD